MAENKKSFILYADIIHTVRKMPKEKAGELFMTILSYVNDEDPTVEDLLVEVAFEPIKQQLKRDLKKWEDFKEKQSLNGKKGGRPHKGLAITETEGNPNNPTLLDESQKSLNVNVNVNDTVNDNVSNDIVANATKKIKSIETFEKRQQDFYNSIAQYAGIYPKEMMAAFYNYWREPNKSKTKMRFELEKTWDLNLRLQKWANNNFKHISNGPKPINGSDKPGTSTARVEAARAW